VQLSGIHLPDLVAQGRVLVELVERHLATERALAEHLAGGTSQITTDWGKVVVYEYRDYRVRFVLPGGGNIKTAKYIYEKEIDWPLLMQDAMRASSIPKDAWDLHLAAFFWFWKSEHGAAYFRRLAEHPQTILMHQFDNQLFTDVVAQLDRFTIDFAAPDERWKNLWSGDETKLTGKALRWSSTRCYDPARPMEFPIGLSLDTGKPQPAAIRLACRILPGSKVMVCFMRPDGRPVRLAFDLILNRIGGVVVDDHGRPQAKPLRPLPLADFDAATHVRLAATVGNGTLAITLNDRPFPETYAFLGTGPVTVQLQTFQLNGTSTVEVSTLAVE
jgi:hypothetical protein